MFVAVYRHLSKLLETNHVEQKHLIEPDHKGSNWSWQGHDGTKIDKTTIRLETFRGINLWVLRMKRTLILLCKTRGCCLFCCCWFLFWTKKLDTDTVWYQHGVAFLLHNGATTLLSAVSNGCVNRQYAQKWGRIYLLSTALYEYTLMSYSWLYT